MAELDGGAPLSFELLRQEAEQTTLLRVEGELDLSSIESVEAAVDPMIEAHPDRLVIDASGLQFADSSAIAALVKWAKLVRELQIRQPPPLLRAVIESMGLAETLPMAP
jgi:anti-sigma B factor antagonist